MIVLELTPLSWSLTVAVLVGALYLKSRHWRRFIENQRAKTATVIGANPQEVRAILRQVQGLLTTDPRAAEQLLAASFSPVRQRRAAERERLLGDALKSPEAAARLRQLVQEDAETYRSALRYLSGHHVAPGILQEIRDEVAALDQVDAQIARSRP